MSQPVDPWTYLRHQNERTDRLLRRRRTPNTDRVTVHHRKAGPRD
jgi:hypothetical protein